MIASKGEEIVEAMDSALHQLDALAGRPHSRRDLCGVIDNAAAQMEEFLRATAFPGSSRHDSSAKLIENLATLGLDPLAIADLDALRDLYNHSKHDPKASFRFADVRRVIAASSRSFQVLSSLGIASIDAPPDSSLAHHLWVGAWDHLMGGETEVAIVLPSAHWTHIGTFDNVHLDYKSWEALKLALAAHSNFKWGEEHFDPDVWVTFTRDSDFLNAGVWDGDYGGLLRILARFHDDSKMRQVLPGLQRGRNGVSIGAAIVTAAIDVARSSTNALDAGQFAHHVASRAAAEYALNCEATHPAVVQLAEFIARRPYTTWKRLSGPLIVDKEWAANVPRVDGPLPIAVDGDRIALVAAPG
jgi:hypothetical protein